MAFNSSEAVMNNRFIKMFWHSDRGNVKNRLGGGGGFGPGKFSKTISNDINQEEVCNKGILNQNKEINLVFNFYTIHSVASLFGTHTDNS